MADYLCNRVKSGEEITWVSYRSSKLWQRCNHPLVKTTALPEHSPTSFWDHGLLSRSLPQSSSKMAAVLRGVCEVTEAGKLPRGLLTGIFSNTHMAQSVQTNCETFGLGPRFGSLKTWLDIKQNQTWRHHSTQTQTESLATKYSHLCLLQRCHLELLEWETNVIISNKTNDSLVQNLSLFYKIHNDY